ncbi:MAG: hypothetical protein V2A73_11790, partial [Pseudomonadota bacterium]
LGSFILGDCGLWKPVPSLPLLTPVRATQHLSQLPLAHRLDTVDRLRLENPLLDVGGEQRQIHELRDPCSGDAEPPGDFWAPLDTPGRGLERLPGCGSMPASRQMPAQQAIQASRRNTWNGDPC